MCMVLYGYDASTYNSVQASSNWLAWFNLTSVRILPTTKKIHTYIPDHKSHFPIKDVLTDDNGYSRKVFISSV